MITESFINSCFTVAINKNIKVKKNVTMFRDIIAVLEFYQEKEKLEIPLNVQNKFHCLIKICKMIIDGKTAKNAIDSMMHSEKYKHLHDFLDHKRNEQMNDTVAVDNINQIRLRKKLNTLFSNYDELSTFLDQLKEGSFESIDDLVLDYEKIIKKLYTNMMTENRGIAIESSASLDLNGDEYDHVLDLIVKKYQENNTIPTGFNVLDKEVLNGGSEPSRLYIIGGAPGSGKSTFLNNLIISSATTIKPVDPIKKEEEQFVPKKDGIENVYVYITLENTIEESLLRTYQPLFKKNKVDVLREITEGVNIKQKLVDELKKTNSTIIMKYFPAKTISVSDIMVVLDDIKSEYGDCLKGLYVDYLDLLKTDTKYDMYRIELGDITLSFKSLAVEYNIPVWVPTQLGRSAYRVQGANDLNLDQVSESVKKIEHADFVMLLSRDPGDQHKVYGKVGKNRSGVSGMNLEFNVDYSFFKFLTATKISNDQQPTVVDSIQRIPDATSQKPVPQSRFNEFKNISGSSA